MTYLSLEIQMTRLARPSANSANNTDEKTWYLKVQIHSLSDGYFLHQADYTKQLPREAGMSKCRPSTIPLHKGIILLSDMSSSIVDATYYSRVVGKLIYLMNTQPNINYFVGIVSRYMAPP